MLTIIDSRKALDLAAHMNGEVEFNTKHADDFDQIIWCYKDILKRISDANYAITDFSNRSVEEQEAFLLTSADLDRIGDNLRDAATLARGFRWVISSPGELAETDRPDRLAAEAMIKEVEEGSKELCIPVPVIHSAAVRELHRRLDWIGADIARVESTLAIVTG